MFFSSNRGRKSGPFLRETTVCFLFFEGPSMLSCLDITTSLFIIVTVIMKLPCPNEVLNLIETMTGLICNQSCTRAM